MAKGVFISYRRDTGSTMARMIYDRLRLEKNCEVFLDVESLNAGDFRREIERQLALCDTFILVLSRNALDRCVNDNDNVRQEILAAFRSKLKIVPVTAEDFQWPVEMPKGLENLKNYNAIPYIQVYSEAFFERLYTFMGEQDKTVRSNGIQQPGPKVYYPPKQNKKSSIGMFIAAFLITLALVGGVGTFALVSMNGKKETVESESNNTNIKESESIEAKAIEVEERNDISQETEDMTEVSKPETSSFAFGNTESVSEKIVLMEPVKSMYFGVFDEAADSLGNEYDNGISNTSDGLFLYDNSYATYYLAEKYDELRGTIACYSETKTDFIGKISFKNEETGETIYSQKVDRLTEPKEITISVEDVKYLTVEITFEREEGIILFADGVFSGRVKKSDIEKTAVIQTPQGGKPLSSMEPVKSDYFGAFSDAVDSLKNEYDSGVCNLSDGLFLYDNSYATYYLNEQYNELTGVIACGGKSNTDFVGKIVFKNEETGETILSEKVSRLTEPYAVTVDLKDVKYLTIEIHFERSEGWIIFANTDLH